MTEEISNNPHPVKENPEEFIGPEIKDPWEDPWQNDWLWEKPEATK